MKEDLCIDKEEIKEISEYSEQLYAIELENLNEIDI
jgi:hypothetical protein